MADDGTLAGCEVIISSDSHVIEPPDTLAERAPAAFKDRVPRFPEMEVGTGFQVHPGGSDPHKRITEMDIDGVSAEVLYPSHLLLYFAMDDARLQEVSFRAYNDWLMDYCSVAPDRLAGLAAISMYDIDEAVKELERCARAGLKGSLVWQAPRVDLPFRSDHYEKFWAASEALQLPVHLHILTGHGCHKRVQRAVEKDGLDDIDSRYLIEFYRCFVNMRLGEIINAVFDLIFYGVMERHPGLKFVCAENEIGWMPFMLQQWDYYWNRFKEENPISITRNPSEYFLEQVYGTFFGDTVAAHSFEWWGQDNCMWSSDYPHGNAKWPESKRYVERELGHLPADVRKKLVYTNVKELYRLDIPHPAQ